MNIDIEALSDFVENLMWGYLRKGWLKRLPDVLNRLKTNIDDPRWLAKIAYHRGICALWRDDRETASRELEPLQPITPICDDVDLLQIQLDLNGASMGMSERTAFFDRICTLSKSRSDKLQYGGARSFELLMVEDEGAARTSFDAVIALAREMEAEKPLSPAAEFWFCRSLEGRAMLDPDSAALFQEIENRLTCLLALPDWPAAGLVDTKIRCLSDWRT
ncbi:hypothetical protein [Sphingobium sp. MK2]|uniref:hypothetical protein n=1 Tax=Sphingobium sp. MK2 TaxID=3116540 RepID=UPI0032E3588D